MGISRDRIHKRRATGARRRPIRAKRKFNMGRQAAMTKLRADRKPLVRQVRCRSGILKNRALRLNAGNFSWGSENCTRRARIVQVVYNATSNELVRTNTLVKGAIVEIDAAPFTEYYQTHFGDSVPSRKTPATLVRKDGSARLLRKLAKRRAVRDVDAAVMEQLSRKRLFARISTSPGQVGKADGYLLEGPELQFYLKKLRA